MRRRETARVDMMVVATGGSKRERQGNEWENFGSIAQQQRTMIHLAPLSRAFIGIGGCIGGTWSIVFGLGVAVGLLVLGMRTIAVHGESD